MPRSSKKSKPITEHDDKKITIRTDLDPKEVLDPSSAAAIEAELAKVKELKKSGAPKPKDVTWGDWMGPKKMSPRHYVVANLIAMGLRGSEICQETGLTATQVSHLMNNSLIKAYVGKLQHYYTTDAKKRFDALVPNAVKAFEDVLAPHSQEQTKLKVDVASKVMDRAWGRAQNDQQDAGNTVLNLLRGLKELNQSAHLDPVEAAKPVYSAVEASGASGVARAAGEGAPAPFLEDASQQPIDDGSISGLLDTWENGDNEDSGENEEENGETQAES